MKSESVRHANLITWLLILLPPLILLAPALRRGYTLLPAQMPYQVDPLWQPLAPLTASAANPILSDQFYQYHAWKVTLWRSLAQGELPWWTIAVNGGQPLLANGQVGLFDPFNVVGMLFSLPASYVVGALLRLWVAGAFTFLYARSIGLSHRAAWLALLTFTHSTLLVNWLGATPSHVLVWLPVLCWVGEKLLATRHVAWALACAVGLALLLYSSQPEIAFQVGIAWSIYLLVRAIWLEGGVARALRRHARGWLLIALLALALAAVEVLPFVDALRQSVVFSHRADSPQLDFFPWLQRLVMSWQLWPTLVTILLPNFLGREQDESYWFPIANSFENNAYAGVLPLLLALLALWVAWRNQLGSARRWVWLWGALGVGALALAVELPLFKGVNDLPPFSLVAPGRWRGVYVFAVALLAGFGLDFLLAQTTLPRRFAVLLVGAAVVNMLLVAAAYVGFTLYADELISAGRAFMEANVGSPALDRPLDELYALVETRQQAKLAMLAPSNPVMYLPLLVAVAVALLWWLHHGRRTMRARFATGLLLLTWLDLLWVGADINVTSPIAWLEPLPPAIEYLQEQSGEFRVIGTHLILNPNMSMLTQLEDVRGYDPLVSNRYRALLAGLDGFAPSGYHNYFRHLDDPRLDLFNAVYGLSRTPPRHPRWEAVFDDPSGVTLYRSRTALPRAYLVYDAEIVSSPAQSLARTLDPAFEPRHQVILEESPTGWNPPTSPPSAPPQVEFRQRRANALQLEVNTSVPALLVLLDTYATGWRATIDQQPATIYPANHTFRAVVVPAGRHMVAFSYAPPGLMLGVSISVGAWLVVLGLLLGLGYAKYRPLRSRGRRP